VSAKPLLGRLTQRRGLRQFVKFGIVGASGFVVNLIVFTVLQRVVPDHDHPLQYNVLFSVAFLAGGLSNYFLNRAWTFRSQGNVQKEGLSFMAVSVLALVVGLIVGQAVAPWLGHGHKTWFVSVLAGIVVNFFVNKYWTFRKV
jgi:putative flippase GtrA